MIFKGHGGVNKKMMAAKQETSARDRILDAARHLFGERGFHQTSMAELANSAQVSVGLIYRLFKGKEDIIEAIVACDVDENIARTTDLRARLDRGEISIEQTFEQLLLQVLDDKDEALSFDILAEGTRNPSVGRAIGDMCIRYRRFLRHFACAANPALSGEALDGAEDMILSCIFGMGHRTLSCPNLAPEAIARRGAQMIVAALQATG